MLFAMLIASIMKKQLETGVLFRTAVYAKVFMFVIMMILEQSRFVNFKILSLLLFFIRVAATIGFMALVIAELPENRQAPMPMGPGMGPGQGWQ